MERQAIDGKIDNRWTDRQQMDRQMDRYTIGDQIDDKLTDRQKWTDMR